jgi:hypothetical protein
MLLQRRQALQAGRLAALDVLLHRRLLHGDMDRRNRLGGHLGKGACRLTVIGDAQRSSGQRPAGREVAHHRQRTIAAIGQPWSLNQHHRTSSLRFEGVLQGGDLVQHRHGRHTQQRLRYRIEIGA